MARRIKLRGKRPQMHEGPGLEEMAGLKPEKVQRGVPLFTRLHRKPQAMPSREEAVIMQLRSLGVGRMPRTAAGRAKLLKSRLHLQGLLLRAHARTRAEKEAKERRSEEWFRRVREKELRDRGLEVMREMEEQERTAHEKPPESKQELLERMEHLKEDATKRVSARPSLERDDIIGKIIDLRIRRGEAVPNREVERLFHTSREMLLKEEEMLERPQGPTPDELAFEALKGKHRGRIGSPDEWERRVNAFADIAFARRQLGKPLSREEVLQLYESPLESLQKKAGKLGKMVKRLDLPVPEEAIEEELLGDQRLREIENLKKGARDARSLKAAIRTAGKLRLGASSAEVIRAIEKQAGETLSAQEKEKMSRMIQKAKKDAEFDEATRIALEISKFCTEGKAEWPQNLQTMGLKELREYRDRILRRQRELQPLSAGRRRRRTSASPRTSGGQGKAG